MLNRGLNCVVRPNSFDFWKERQVDPISGYGIIPLLAAAIPVGASLLGGKAKKKQAKRDAKAAKAEAARQQAAIEAANRRRQTTMIIAFAGVAVVGAIAFGVAKSRKK